MNYRFSLDNTDDEWEYIIPSPHGVRVVVVAFAVIEIILLLIFNVLPWLISL